MGAFDIRQIEYFIEAEAAGSMSKAAKLLGVTEQALSHGISRLEAALGSSLFDRSPAGISPTAFGRFFGKRARLLKAAYELAERAPEDFRNRTGMRRIVVGALRDCIADYGGTLGIATIRRMQAMFPDVELDFDVCPAAELAGRLANGTYRFGIAGPQGDPFAQRILKAYPLAVIARADSAIAGCPAVRLDQLEGCQIALSSGDQPLMDFLRRIGGDGFRRVETLVYPIAPVDRTDYLTAPDVVTILPQQHAFRTVKNAESVVLPLVDDQGDPVRVALALQWLKQHPLDSVERSVAAYLAMLYENDADTRQKEARA